MDSNNVYGGAMSEALPIGDFTFLPEDEVTVIRFGLDNEIRRLRLYTGSLFKVPRTPTRLPLRLFPSPQKN